MHSLFLAVASLVLLAACTCAQNGEVIQHIPPKVEGTQLATGKDGVKSGVAAEGGAGKPLSLARSRRDIAGQESDLLPSGNEVDISAFGENSQLEGRGRIRVLPAFLG